MSRYPRVKMGRFLTHRKEFITIDDFQEYKRARVQLHGKGIVLRDIIEGGRLRTKKQQVARAGEFLVAEIDAKVGGFGIVPPELDGAIVSSHYFLFEIDETVCLPAWLDWYARGDFLKAQVPARGSTNYAAIRPHHVLEFEIPLPPLDEQRRIVARVESLAERIAEAQQLRQEAVEEANKLQRSEWEQIFRYFENKFESDRLGNPRVATIIAGQHILVNDYNQHGDGFPYLTGPADFGKKTPTVSKWTNNPKSIAKPGDILLTVKGAGVGKVNFALDMDVAIGRQIMTIRAQSISLLPSYLFYFLKHKFLYIQSLATATTVPGIKKTDVKNLLLPLPPPPEQRRIVAYLDALQKKVDALRALQEETQKELDALLPSVLDKAFRGEL